MGSLSQKGSNSSYIIYYLPLWVGALITMPIETTASLPDTTNSKSVSEVLVDKNKDGKLDFLEQQVTVTGRASVGSSIMHNQYLMLYLQDSSAGMLAFSDKPQNTVSRGDSLVVTGKLQLYYGKAEIVVDSLKVIETGGNLPEPIKLDSIFINPERHYGMLTEGQALITGKDYNSEYTKFTITTSVTTNNSMGIYVPNEHAHYEDFNFDMYSVGDFVNVKGIVDSYTF